MTLETVCRASLSLDAYRIAEAACRFDTALRFQDPVAMRRVSTGEQPAQMDIALSFLGDSPALESTLRMTASSPRSKCALEA